MQNIYLWSSKDVMPYLIRRAEENTSVAGQTSRELGLINAGKKEERTNSSGKSSISIMKKLQLVQLEFFIPMFFILNC
jgi:hypothetical protein